jgi:hypothetical protein|tara:strand:- start:44 stop:604 length:561 start_codon:yes stop_codon:yes gene_type:complete
MSFSHITKAATQKLRTRVQSIWFDANGEPKENYIWKISDNTPKGDAGEEIVGGIFKELYSELYEGYTVKVDIVGAEKGDYDVIVTVEELDITIKIEVKTATLDSNGKFQWNGLKKGIDYDYAFGLGVRPDDYIFAIQSRKHLEDRLTTNMSRDVEGSYKWTSIKKDNIKVLNKENFTNRLEELSLV